MTEPGTVKRSWIYQLPKEKLTAWLRLLGQDPDGRLDDLRKRMSTLTLENPERFQNIEELIHPAKITEPAVKTTATEDRRTLHTTNSLTPEGPDTVSALNQIRKWGYHFDGRDPVSFLERIEELQAAYGLTSTEMLAGLPELLKNDALMWYRNHRAEWENWEDFARAFREHYLPRRYRTQLLRELQSRQQHEAEPYARYATHVLTLMRRAGHLSRAEQLEQLYEGLRPEYKLYIRRHDIDSIPDLAALAQEFEAIADTRRATPAPATRTASATPAYNREECCWRYKQRGHTRADCKRPPKKFCSQCGKDGVLTRDCHPRPGNPPRVGTDLEPSRPPTTSN